MEAGVVVMLYVEEVSSILHIICDFPLKLGYLYATI